MPVGLLDQLGVHLFIISLNGTAPGNGIIGRSYAFVVWNGELYAGGDFNTAGGNTAHYIAKWDGVNWSPVGAGMDSTVYALTVYNNELYAGGDFTMADGSPANHIAKWNGTNWSALGSGTNSTVRAFEVYNGDLYVGGAFTAAGGNTAKYIAKWNNPVGIKNNFINDEISVYPNPATDRIYIGQSNPGKKINAITLIDIYGIKYERMLNDKNEFDVNDLKAGVYIVLVNTGKETLRKKIIVGK